MRRFLLDVVSTFGFALLTLLVVLLIAAALLLGLSFGWLYTLAWFVATVLAVLIVWLIVEALL